MDNYYSGVANSLPVVTPMVVSIQQNGEVGDHSNDPAFYQNEIPSTGANLYSHLNVILILRRTAIYFSSML